MLEQFSGKYSSKVGTLVRKKSGPLGSDPTEVVLDNSAKMLPTVAALLFVNLDVDAELDKVPIIVLLPLLSFSVMGRSMRHSFFGGQDKLEASKDFQLE